MIIKHRTCYSHILYIMAQGEVFSSCVSSIKIESPGHTHEGMTGYIETDVTIEIKGLSSFAELWDGWYNIDEAQRTYWYRVALGKYK